MESHSSGQINAPNDNMNLEPILEEIIHVEFLVYNHSQH